MHRIVCPWLLAAVVIAQEPVSPRPTPTPVPTPAPAPGSPAAPGAAPTGRAIGGLSELELAQAMTATMRLSTPGEPHQRLAALAGQFAVEMTLQPPGIEPKTTRGQARAQSVLGGRYLIVHLDVPVQNTRLEGLYVLGFDNLHGLYTASWRDSMSTWSVECSGPPSENTPQRIELQGTMVDAASPTGRPFRMELRILDTGFEVAVRDTVGDQEVEVVRQTFVRQPAREGERGK